MSRTRSAGTAARGSGEGGGGRGEGGWEREHRPSAGEGGTRAEAASEGCASGGSGWDAAIEYLDREGSAVGVRVSSRGRASVFLAQLRRRSDPAGDDVPDARKQGGDSLGLVVEYCFTTLTCHLLLSDEEDEAPDLILHSSLKGFYPQLDELGLDDWNRSDPSCLLGLVLRLRRLYATHCNEAVRALAVDRVNFDFECISHVPGVQCIVTERYSENPSVFFRIPLGHDPDPSRRPSENDMHHAVARVRYALRKNASGSVELAGVSGEVMLPDEWRRRSCSFRLPAAEDSATLVEYLADLDRAIRDGLRQHACVVESREDFMRALLDAYGHAVLDYDTAEFRHLTMYVEFEGSTTKAETNNCFLVIVKLPPNYPAEPPVISLYSPVAYASPSPTEYRPDERTFALPKWPWPAGEIADRFKHCIVKEAKEWTKWKLPAPKKLIDSLLG